MYFVLAFLFSLPLFWEWFVFFRSSTGPCFEVIMPCFSWGRFIFICVCIYNLLSSYPWDLTGLDASNGGIIHISRYKTSFDYEKLIYTVTDVVIPPGPPTLPTSINCIYSGWWRMTLTFTEVHAWFTGPSGEPRWRPRTGWFTQFWRENFLWPKIFLAWFCWFGL